MKRSPLFRAATPALFLLACSPSDVAEQPAGPDDPTPTPGTKKPAPDPEPEPEPLPPEEDPISMGTPCRVDADCDAGAFCELRICVAGCEDAAACDAGQVCDPHGRCQAEDGAPRAPLVAAPPTLGERRTVLAVGGTEAQTVLYNTGDETLVYRLAAAHPALTLDTAPQALAPGEEATLVVTVDLGVLAPDDHILPVQIITNGGGLLWSIELPQAPAAGHFRGLVSFAADVVSLGSSPLVVDLDFRADGTVVGRVDNGASVLWPQPLALTGTWAEDGAVAIELRDLLPAESWQQSPISRELGRVLVLTGTRTADGIEGTVTESITGMRADAVVLGGSFALRRDGPLTGIVHVPDLVPEDAAAPDWLAPPGLDLAACAGLGSAYGTDATLPEPEPACDACTDKFCSSEDMMACGVALRDAAYNVDDVLGPLQGGGVVPPADAWTWDDCTADTPEYNADGLTCLDHAALRCGDALVRRGSADYPGAWGEALRAVTALFAADEAVAAALLATEAEVDAVFAFRDEIGEPAQGALGREVSVLAASRERLAAALAPMLAPAHPAGLAWIEEQSPDTETAQAHGAPLRLAAAFATTTARWSRLAHRAGEHPDDVRAAVRLALIAVHAAAAELHARLGDDPDVAPDLHALGAALASLQRVDDELAPDSGAFGYPSAYVPIALSPEDIAKSRTNFDAIHDLAADEIVQFQQVATDAWQTALDYQQKTYTLVTTAAQIEADYDQKLRALCGSLPGETEPAISTCGQQGGQIADLRAAVDAAGLRIRHAGQAAENNVHAVAVEEERFARQVEIHLSLSAEIEAAHGQIFQVKDKYGNKRSALAQAEAHAECGRIKENMRTQSDELATSCTSMYLAKANAGPAIFGFSTPDLFGMMATLAECDAKERTLQVTANNQCDSVRGQAGLAKAQEELQRVEDEEVIAINAEIDQAIRDSDLESQRAASVALIKNLRAEALLLAIETEEAELTRSAALTSLSSAYQEVAALAQEKARMVGVMVEDSPDNVLTHPHFLQARLAAAARVLPVRERAIRRVYLALRALEYELSQELPALRDTLAGARAPEDLAGLMACLAGIAEDYRLDHGYGQPYVTEVSLRADIFGITDDVPDVDGSPATPAEQFAALLTDPLHAQADGGVALPFSLSAYENPQFSALLCDDRIDKIEVKLVGDFLGDREAEVMLTRQGLAGVRRCDGAELPQWSAYSPYSFDRQQVVIQAGVQDWGTAGPNAGFAAWPVHGEQWTLTIPPPEQSPANLDLDLAHVSDVVLRLHHRAGTIAPVGQGTFTPSCG